MYDLVLFVLGVALAQVARGLAALLVDGGAGGAQPVDATCVEIKILRRVRAESSRRPPRHRRDACSMGWRCWFLTTISTQVATPQRGDTIVRAGGERSLLLDRRVNGRRRERRRGLGAVGALRADPERLLARSYARSNDS